VISHISAWSFGFQIFSSADALLSQNTQPKMFGEVKSLRFKKNQFMVLSLNFVFNLYQMTAIVKILASGLSLFLNIQKTIGFDHFLFFIVRVIPLLINGARNG